MKNSKKVIIITIIIATILSCVIGFITYKITLNNGMKNKQNYMKIGNYSLQYGIYKGYNIEYEWDVQKESMVESNKSEVILKFNSNNTYELNGQKHRFSVVGTNIIVPDLNNIPMFEAIEIIKLNIKLAQE